MTSRPMRLAALLLAVALSALPVVAQTPKVATPKEALGFNLGDDYQVANYAQLEAYWKKLESESDRMKLVDIGPPRRAGTSTWRSSLRPPTSRSSTATKRSRRSWRTPMGSPKSRARALAQEGKAVVWIDMAACMPASRWQVAQQLMEMVYQMVSRTGSRDHAFPERRGAALRAGQPGRAGADRQLVHAGLREARTRRWGSAKAEHEQPAAPLRQIRRS